MLYFRQKVYNIVKYIREGDRLKAEYPKKFQDLLRYQFIAGLYNKRKLELV